MINDRVTIAKNEYLEINCPADVIIKLMSAKIENNEVGVLRKLQLLYTDHMFRFIPIIIVVLPVIIGALIYVSYYTNTNPEKLDFPSSKS